MFYVMLQEMIFIASLFMMILSSIMVSIEGKHKIFNNVELKWKLEVTKMINYMTTILQMNGSAPGICS